MVMNDGDGDDDNDARDMGDRAQGGNDWDGDQKYVAQPLDGDGGGGDDDNDDDGGDE